MRIQKQSYGLNYCELFNQNENVSHQQKYSDSDGYYFNRPKVVFAAQSRSRLFIRKSPTILDHKNLFQQAACLFQVAAALFPGQDLTH